MKSPEEKYMNDPEYHKLVRFLESLIEKAHFTPSELREACILAAVNYEMRRKRMYPVSPEVEDAFKVLSMYRERKE